MHGAARSSRSSMAIRGVAQVELAARGAGGELAGEIDDVAARFAEAVGLDLEARGGEAAGKWLVGFLGPDGEQADVAEGVAGAGERGAAVERVVGALGGGVRALVEIEEDRVVAA